MQVSTLFRISQWRTVFLLSLRYSSVWLNTEFRADD